MIEKNVKIVVYGLLLCLWIEFSSLGICFALAPKAAFEKRAKNSRELIVEKLKSCDIVKTVESSNIELKCLVSKAVLEFVVQRLNGRLDYDPDGNAILLIKGVPIAKMMEEVHRDIIKFPKSHFEYFRHWTTKIILIDVRDKDLSLVLSFIATLDRVMKQIRKGSIRRYQLISKLSPEQQKGRKDYRKGFSDWELKADKPSQITVIRGVEEYNELFRLFGIDIRERIKDLLRELRSNGILSANEPLQILDLGAGEGVFLKQIKEEFKDEIDVYGITLTAFKGKEHLASLGSEGIKLEKGEAENLPIEWTNKFHLIVSVASFSWFRDSLKAIEEAHRVLNSHGEALLDIETRPIHLQAENREILIREIVNQVNKEGHHLIMHPEYNRLLMIRKLFPSERQLIFPFKWISYNYERRDVPTEKDILNELYVDKDKTTGGENRGSAFSQSLKSERNYLGTQMLAPSTSLSQKEVSDSEITTLVANLKSQDELGQLKAIYKLSHIVNEVGAIKLAGQKEINRLRAIDMFDRIIKKAIPSLINCLQSEDKEIKNYAFLILNEHITELRDYLITADDYAGDKIDFKIVEDRILNLLQALEDEDIAVRNIVIRTLIGIGHRSWGDSGVPLPIFHAVFKAFERFMPRYILQSDDSKFKFSSIGNVRTTYTHYSKGVKPLIEEKVPTLMEIYSDEERTVRFLYILSILRVIFPIRLLEIEDQESPLELAIHHQLQVKFRELYIVPFGEAFRRDIIYAVVDEETRFLMEIKLPGQDLDRDLIRPIHYTLAEKLWREFPQNPCVVKPLFFLGFKGSFPLYERVFNYEAYPLGLVGFTYEDGIRWSNFKSPTLLRFAKEQHINLLVRCEISSKDNK